MACSTAIGLVKRCLCALALLQVVCFAGAPAEPAKDASIHMAPIAEARLRAAIKARLDNDDDYRSLCSGVKICLDMDYPGRELDAGADPRREQPEQVEIQHVGYDADQLGRNK